MIVCAGVAGRKTSTEDEATDCVGRPERWGVGTLRSGVLEGRIGTARTSTGLKMVEEAGEAFVATAAVDGR